VGAGSSTLPEFATALGLLRRSLEAAGRADAPFAISKRVYLHVLADGDDRSDVVAQLRQWFAHHYGNPSGADRFVVVGSAAECADHVGRVRQMGASTVILHPMVEPLEQLERLTEGVVPQVR
jgi:alkanesulfonate monooxygenase SsuD/methylene tetrahydromethanopterin reductase-like flavin-dependent oxidoreductase (luciferase family)